MGCRGMNMNEIATIPYYVHEGIVTRMERCNRRLAFGLVVVAVALVAENIAMMTQDDDEDA